MRKSIFFPSLLIPLAIAACEDGPNQTFQPATGTLFNNGDSPASVSDASAPLTGAFGGSTKTQICTGDELQQQWGAMDSQLIAPVRFMAGLDLDNGPTYPLLTVEQTELGPLAPVKAACVTEPSKGLYGAVAGATPASGDPCLVNATQSACAVAANNGALCGWNVIPYLKTNGKPADLTSDPPAPTRLCQAQNLGQGASSGQVGGSLVAGFGNANEFSMEWAVPTHRAYYLDLNQGYIGHMTWNYLTSSDGKVHTYDVSIGQAVKKDGANYEIDWSDSGKSAQQADEIYRGIASTFAPDIYDDAPPGVTLVDTGTGFVNNNIGGGSGEIGMRPVSFYIVFFPNTLGAAEGVTVLEMYAYNIKYAPYSGAASYFKMYDPAGIAKAQPFATASLGNGGPSGAPVNCSFGIGDTFENLLNNCIDVFTVSASLKGTDADPNVIAQNKVLGDLSHDDQNYAFQVVGISQNFRPAKLDVCNPALTAAGLDCGTDIEDVVHDTDSLLTDAKNATANEFQSDVRSFGAIQNDAFPPGTPLGIPCAAATASKDCASAPYAAVCDTSGDANNDTCVSATWNHDYHGGGAIWREYGRIVQRDLNAKYVAMNGDATLAKAWHDPSCFFPQTCLGAAGATPATCAAAHGSWGTGPSMEMSPPTPCTAATAAAVCTQAGATCYTSPTGLGLVQDTCIIPFDAVSWRPARGCTGFESMVDDAEPRGDGSALYPTAADDLWDGPQLNGVGTLKPGDPVAKFCNDPGTFNFCDTTVAPGVTDLLAVSASQVLAFLGNGNLLALPEDGRDKRYFFQQWSLAYAKYMISPHVLDTGLQSAGAIVNGVAVNGNQVGDFSGQFVDTDNFIYDSSGGGGARSEFVDFDVADLSNDPVSLEQKMLLIGSNLQNTNFYRKLDREERALLNSLAVDPTQASWGYLRNADGTFQQDTYVTGASVRTPKPGAGTACTSDTTCAALAPSSICDRTAGDANNGLCVNAFNRHNANPFLTNLAGTGALSGPWSPAKAAGKLVPAPAGWTDPCNPVSSPPATCTVDSDCAGVMSCNAGACVAAKTAYFCATHIDADCAGAGDYPPLNDDGSILTRANGKPLLEGYCAVFGQPGPYTLGGSSAISVVATFPDEGEAFVSLPMYQNPYAGAAPTGSVKVMVPWLPFQEGVGYPVANGATGGSQDVFVVTAQLDFTGQVITPTMDYLPVPGNAQDPNPLNPAVPFGVNVQAWETQDFLGEVFLCYDTETDAARKGSGRPGDILSAHMYTPAASIIDWLTSHPTAQSGCQIVVRYSPFNNFPDYITTLSNGVRLGIDQGVGFGRVVDATLFVPGTGTAAIP